MNLLTWLLKRLKEIRLSVNLAHVSVFEIFSFLYKTLKLVLRKEKKCHFHLSLFLLLKANTLAHKYLITPHHHQINGRYDMGTETPSLNAHSPKPNKSSISLFTALHLQPNPLLPQLGIPSSSLQQGTVPISPFQMGFLSLPQEGLQTRVS